MKLNNIHEFDVIRIQKEHNYSKLEKEFENYLSNTNFSVGGLISNHALHRHRWLNIYEDLIKIFDKYFIIEDNNKCKKVVIEHNLSGSFVNINEKYTKNFLINVSQLSIKKAYPQRINTLIGDNLKSNDGYFPFLFRIIYSLKNSKAKNFFLNFSFGYFFINNINNEFTINIDLGEEVVKFYADIHREIPIDLYYYVDTNTIFFPEKNSNKIKEFYDKQNIEYEIENNIKVRFLRKKTYYSIDKSGKTKHGTISDDLIDSTKRTFKKIILNTKLKKLKSARIE